MTRHPDDDPFGADAHHNRDWWARSSDDRRGDYPEPDDAHDGDGRGHDGPRHSSQYPSPPADETADYCRGCGRPLESGGSAYCDACKARGRHRGVIQEDQLDESPSHQSRTSTDQPEQAATPPEQPTALAEYHQAIANRIDPILLEASPGNPDRTAKIRLLCPECEKITRHVIDRYLTTLEEAAETPAGRLTDACAKRRQRELGAASLQCTTPGCTHTQPRGPRPQPQ